MSANARTVVGDVSLIVAILLLALVVATVLFNHQLDPLTAAIGALALLYIGVSAALSMRELVIQRRRTTL